MNSKEYDKLTIEAVRKVAPSVVSIVITKYLPRIKVAQSPNMFNPFMFEDVEDGAKQRVQVGGGSGFIVHSDGLILTNKHVVFDKEAEYAVIMPDGSEHISQVISRDPVNDIAVLKMESPSNDLPTLQLGDSVGLELGQTVVAIGNALGIFSNTVSKGIVSGLSRSIAASLGGGEGAAVHTERLRGVIQTDVAINQGNSGGPLINLDGQAIAINTAVIFGAQNIGFSIPINWAKSDIEDIVKYGRIIKPYVGLMYISINKDMKKKYELPVDHGVIIIRDHLPNSVAVIPGSPAEKAGIKEGDIVTHVADKELTDKVDLTDMLQQRKVGETVELSVIRKNKSHKMSVTLEERK